MASRLATNGREKRWTEVAPPNVEVTGRRRQASLAVRPKMSKGGCAAKLACRWSSG